MGAVDHPHYVTIREELEEDFEASYVDLALDTLVAMQRDGRVLAWGLVLEPPGQESLVREILVGGVRPDARGQGLGRQLLEWQVARGVQRLAASTAALPGWLMTAADSRVEDAARLYARFGIEPARYFLELQHDLGDAVPAVDLDGALRFEEYTPARSEATRVARNDAFRDHWGSQPANEEQWDSMVGRSIFRADLSFLAVSGAVEANDEVAGFVIASVSEDDWPAQGFSSAYIDLVGVTRAWRKRGIAPALLARTLRAIAEAGLEKAVLDVDSESPTGALGLYSGLGFTTSNSSVNFTKVF